MKTALTFLFLAIFTQAPLQGETSPVTPIVVQIHRDSLLRPTINGNSMSIPEVKRFLQESAERFGTKYPVIIQLDQDQGIDIAVTLLALAHKTHDEVFLGLKSHHIVIPKDGIKMVRLPDGNPDYIVPKIDDSPNRRGQEQNQHLLDIQQNKIN